MDPLRVQDSRPHHRCHLRSTGLPSSRTGRRLRPDHLVPRQTSTQAVVQESHVHQQRTGASGTRHRPGPTRLAGADPSRDGGLPHRPELPQGRTIRASVAALHERLSGGGVPDPSQCVRAVPEDHGTDPPDGVGVSVGEGGLSKAPAENGPRAQWRVDSDGCRRSATLDDPLCSAGRPMEDRLDRRLRTPHSARAGAERARRAGGQVQQPESAGGPVRPAPTGQERAPHPGSEPRRARPNLRGVGPGTFAEGWRLGHHVCRCD